jgi:hypothetical protein
MGANVSTVLVVVALATGLQHLRSSPRSLIRSPADQTHERNQAIPDLPGPGEKRRTASASSEFVALLESECRLTKSRPECQGQGLLR